jgi:hypothetical protein
MSGAFIVDKRIGERSATITSNIQLEPIEEILDVCPLFGLKVLNFINLIAEAGVSRKGRAGAVRADPSLRVTTTTH